LPQILNQYAARDVSYSEKNLMKLTPVANYIKLFRLNLHCYRHIASSFESCYAARDVSYSEKNLMKLTPVANYIKPFWHNLCYYQHIALISNSSYTARSINVVEKIFMKLTPDGLKCRACTTKLFTMAIKAVFTLVNFTRGRHHIVPSLLALATMGSTTEIEMILIAKVSKEDNIA
jgi:hypothetical protein